MKTSWTVMLTSVTSRPVIRSTEPTTLRRMAVARSVIATPYSATMSRSTAAWRSPTSTATPCVRLVRDPGIRSRIAPTARAAPPPRACTPSISRAAIPAIFDTTVSAIEVRPSDGVAGTATSVRVVPVDVAVAADVVGAVVVVAVVVVGVLVESLISDDLFVWGTGHGVVVRRGRIVTRVPG
ncbi:hypothetical protein NOCARDAX2BIS_400080 [Nocardioides sp. AX2bis]|nr:hypothetical protein NOCARDAX2BIS_400080 [Nocardioides sp. AX2bis]